MSQLSFNVPRKPSVKMPKIVREICVQVREKVRESHGNFFLIFGGNLVDSLQGQHAERQITVTLITMTIDRGKMLRDDNDSL